jgi:tripartite-type tricarboxylate transporter receptor subunit TctC
MLTALQQRCHTHKFNQLILMVCIALGTSLSYAQSYPNRTVKMIVPLTTGSGADIAGRVVAKSLSETWKQSVIIENRPGAGGLIGTGVVVNAEPDGYTLLVQSASYAANPAIYKKLPYDPLKSLVDVAILGQTPYVMITAADGPYQSIRDLVIAAKSKPNEITFASAGVGSSTHLAAEYFNQVMGIKLIHVPYKGSPEAISDTMSGRTAFYMAPLDTAIGQLKGGKVRALGVTSKARNPAVPEIPSVAELGYANFEIGLWFGVWAPAATPAAIVKKLNQDINQAMQDPEVKTAYETKGIKATPMSPTEFAKFVREEMGKYQKIAKEAAIEPQ